MPEPSYDRQLPVLLRVETDDGTATDPAPAAVDVYGNVTAATVHPSAAGFYTRVRLTVGDTDVVAPLLGGPFFVTDLDVRRGLRITVEPKIEFTSTSAAAAPAPPAGPAQHRPASWYPPLLLARLTAAMLAVAAIVAAIGGHPELAVGYGGGAASYMLFELSVALRRKGSGR